MRRFKWSVGLAVCGAMTVMGSAMPAWAAPVLKWTSPSSVTSGVPVSVASIAPCPPVPNPGDTGMVQIFLSFGAAGGSGQVLSLNPDGSWSGDVTFNFSGVSLHRTTLSASCVDVNMGGIPYAQYQNHHVQIFD